MNDNKIYYNPDEAKRISAEPLPRLEAKTWNEIVFPEKFARMKLEQEYGCELFLRNS